MFGNNKKTEKRNIFMYYNTDNELTYRLDRPEGKDRYIGTKLAKGDTAHYMEKNTGDIPMLELFGILAYRLPLNDAEEILSGMAPDTLESYLNWITAAPSEKMDMQKKQDRPMKTREYNSGHRRRESYTVKPNRNKIVKPLSMERDGVNRDDFDPAPMYEDDEER